MAAQKRFWTTRRLIVAFCQEPVRTKHPQLLYETKLYRILQGGGKSPLRQLCGQLARYNSQKTGLFSKIWQIAALFFNRSSRGPDSKLLQKSHWLQRDAVDCKIKYFD